MSRRVTFKYNLDKEFWNLRAGFYSINQPSEMSRLASEMKTKGVNLENEAQVLKFVQDKIGQEHIDIQKNLSQIKIKWTPIETESISRLDKLFCHPFDFPNMTAFLTLNPRCGYNIKENFFFVFMFDSNTNDGILHELMHFYTHKYISPFFKKNNLSKEQFNDYKEALTVLLNSNFADLLDGDIDKGYEKQKDLRTKIKKVWPKFNNIVDLTKYMVDKW